MSILHTVRLVAHLSDERNRKLIQLVEWYNESHKSDPKFKPIQSREWLEGSIGWMIDAAFETEQELRREEGKA